MIKEESKSLFGFWVYLMTDCILFGTLFATYLVLQKKGAFPVDYPFALTETLILLVSSFSCALAVLFMRLGRKGWFFTCIAITFLLGLSFITMELREFAGLVHEGNSWEKNASLSAFFTLVATHGCHITIGLLGMFILTLITLFQGFTKHVVDKWHCWSLFWHFLDVVWIFIFTVVYLREGI